ncbi:hypothetical protein THAOC_26630, partial [Thalassiosira oceanica]
MMDARGGGRGRRRRYGASLLRSPAFGRVCLVLAALAVALPVLSAWVNRRSDRFHEMAPAMEWPEEETPGDAVQEVGAAPSSGQQKRPQGQIPEFTSTPEIDGQQGETTDSDGGASAI